jgi:hypothetical protein
MADFKEQHMCIELCFIVHRTATGTFQMLKLALGEETGENAKISLVFQGQKWNDINY